MKTVLISVSFKLVFFNAKDFCNPFGNLCQRPAVAGRGCLLQNRTESFRKPVSIGIVFKNVSSFDTPVYHMMQGTRRLPAIASSGEAGGHLFWLERSENQSVFKGLF